jgi:hypothetical protein
MNETGAPGASSYAYRWPTHSGVFGHVLTFNVGGPVVETLHDFISNQETTGKNAFGSQPTLPMPQGNDQFAKDATQRYNADLSFLKNDAERGYWQQMLQDAQNLKLEANYLTGTDANGAMWIKFTGEHAQYAQEEAQYSAARAGYLGDQKEDNLTKEIALAVAVLIGIGLPAELVVRKLREELGGGRKAQPMSAGVYTGALEGNRQQLTNFLLNVQDLDRAARKEKVENLVGWLGRSDENGGSAYLRNILRDPAWSLEFDRVARGLGVDGNCLWEVDALVRYVDDALRAQGTDPVSEGTRQATQQAISPLQRAAETSIGDLLCTQTLLVALEKIQRVHQAARNAGRGDLVEWARSTHGVLKQRAQDLQAWYGSYRGENPLS